MPIGRIIPRTRIILPLIVPLPPPGLPKINTIQDSSSGAAMAWVDMKERVAVRKERRPMTRQEVVVKLNIVRRRRTEKDEYVLTR